MDGLPRPAPEIGAPRGVEGLERRDAVAAAPRVRQRDGEAVDVGRELADEAVARREEEEVVEHDSESGASTRGVEAVTLQDLGRSHIEN